MVLENGLHFKTEETHVNNNSVRSQRIRYSRTSNNGHCRGIQILSVIGGVR
jgi:hypothetical protein